MLDRLKNLSAQVFKERLGNQSGTGSEEKDIMIMIKTHTHTRQTALSSTKECRGGQGRLTFRRSAEREVGDKIQEHASLFNIKKK